MRLILGGVCRRSAQCLEPLLATTGAPIADLSMMRGKAIRSNLHPSLGQFLNARGSTILRLPPDAYESEGDDEWEIIHDLFNATKSVSAIFGFLDLPMSLALAINDGRSMEAVAEGWRRSASKIVELRSRYRSRVLVIDARTALKEPTRCIALFTSRFKLSTKPTNFSGLSEVAADPADLIVAQHYLNGAGAPDAVSAMLEAGTELLADPPATSSVMSTAQGALIVADKLRQIHGIEKRLDVSQRDLESTRQDLESTRRDLESTRHDVESTRKELKITRDKLDAAHKDVSLLKTALGNAKRETAQIKSSIAWRATAPLRRVLRIASGESFRLRRDAALLRRSHLFDAQWYLDRYKDVAASGEDPVKHFLRVAAVERRSPGPKFSTPHYLDRNPDVAAAGVNPLVHYIRQGASEGRATRPVSTPATKE